MANGAVDGGVRELQAEGDRGPPGQPTPAPVVPALRIPSRGAHQHRDRGDRQKDDCRRGKSMIGVKGKR